MKTNLIFCYDRINPDGSGYPNLAKSGLTWQEWDFHWPKTVAIRLTKFFKNNKYHYTETGVDEAPVGSWYPIGISWFDFSCDYFSLIPNNTIELIRNHKIKILFYYHEGDNPYRISERLQSLCAEHNLPPECYLFISANTAANNIENFLYFNDHESFFASINRRQSSNITLNVKRPYDFTVLSRSHKWWRATCVSDLHRNGALENSIWSYHSDCDIGDNINDNPIDLSKISLPVKELQQFVAGGPYRYDLDSASYNNHRFIDLSLLNQSYFNLVIETHFDADQSGGAFLTEKTFKPIKFGQPFVIIGPPHSLKLLRSLGYKTFDNVIDNSYDSIEDNTERWMKTKDTILTVKQQNLKMLFDKCYEDVVYNQYHFASRIKNNLDYIVKEINYRQ